MKGNLAYDCLPDVLRNIYLNRLSGSLRLTQGSVRKEIFFELGAMIFASSNCKEDRIGETLVKHGLLSEEDFNYAQSNMGRGKRFGKVLVDLGLMTERDLIMNVTFQILDIIYSVFDWTTGTYEFTEIEKSVPDDLKLDLSTASIILEGVRRIKDIAVIERGLGDLNRLIGPATNPLMRLQTLSLKPVERQLIELTRHPIGLLQLLVSSKATIDITLRSIYGLISTGVLEQFTKPEISQESGKLVVPEEVQQQLQTPAASPVISKRATGAHQRLERVDEMSARRRILPLLNLISKNDPYLLLGVNQDVNLEDLQNKYFKLARDFHPDKYLNASIELRTDIEQIFSKITDAFEEVRLVITTKNSRLNQELKVTRKSGATPKAILEPVEVVQTTIDEPEQSTLMDMPALEEFVQELVEEEVPITKEIEKEGVEVPSSRSTSFSTTDTADEVANVADDSTAVESKAEVEQELNDLESSSDNQQSRAEEFFAEGRNRFQSKDFSGAANSLRNAIRLNPSEVRYRLLLGHVLSNQQKSHKEAEAEFRKVVEIDPENAMARVGLGQLYIRVGLNKRAEAEFKEALRIEPNNIVAQKGVQALTEGNLPAQSGTSLFSKIFSKK